MTDRELKEIREKISCPQLGDKHYGEWGILTKSQRFTIKRLLDFIEFQEEHIKQLHSENEKLELLNAILTHSCDGYIRAVYKYVEKNEGLLQKLQQAQAENERLKDYINTVEKEVDWYRDELRHSDKKVVTKAYKEVFEKLNDKSIRSKAKVKGCGFLYVSVVTLHDINKLKKELVGEG